jgi:hypothetical protein
MLEEDRYYHVTDFIPPYTDQTIPPPTNQLTDNSGSLGYNVNTEELLNEKCPSVIVFQKIQN